MTLTSPFVAVALSAPPPRAQKAQCQAMAAQTADKVKQFVAENPPAALCVKASLCTAGVLPQIVSLLFAQPPADADAQCASCISAAESAAAVLARDDTLAQLREAAAAGCASLGTETAPQCLAMLDAVFDDAVGAARDFLADPAAACAALDVCACPMHRAAALERWSDAQDGYFDEPDAHREADVELEVDARGRREWDAPRVGADAAALVLLDTSSAWFASLPLILAWSTSDSAASSSSSSDSAFFFRTVDKGASSDSSSSSSSSARSDSGDGFPHGTFDASSSSAVSSSEEDAVLVFQATSFTPKTRPRSFGPW